MTQKWSSKSKEDHTTRVRENQRRHRARTKAYIAAIEKQLAESQVRLEAALAENSRLKGSLEACKSRDSKLALEERQHAMACGMCKEGEPGDGTISVIASLDNGSRFEKHSLQDTGQNQRLEDGESLMSAELQEQELLRTPTMMPSNCSVFSSSADLTPQGSIAKDIHPMLTQKDCRCLPFPLPGESTIPCITAYGIIEEQNYNGMDLRAVDGILAPGFRRAISSEGCRVKSHLVFSVLDSVRPL